MDLRLNSPSGGDPAVYQWPLVTAVSLEPELHIPANGIFTDKIDVALNALHWNHTKIDTLILLIFLLFFFVIMCLCLAACIGELNFLFPVIGLFMF